MHEPKLVYRVVAVCGALGYGYPKESLDEALKGQIDAVISDAGSMDAGPYYLGSGTCYFEREAVKQDFTHMIQAAQQKNCPFILGSCGMAGGDKNLEWMLDVAKEVFAELGITNLKVAVIPGEIDNDLILTEFRNGNIQPYGEMPPLTEDSIKESTLVAQMGIHPMMTALEAGAMGVFCGRSCDIALFASDMIRRGIDPGIAYHVGHVLECGALACDPGTPSDCLVAEIYDDNTALFVAPNKARKATPYSIAAHSLYEESHPQLQFYPEGVLCMEKTEFFAKDSAVSGIRNSLFAHTRPMTVKLEGSQCLGKGRLSVLYCEGSDLTKIPDHYLVYGRNGVEKAEIVISNEREIGIIIETRSQNQESATLLASLLTHYMIHFGYPGRKATAGNVAYPFSPNTVNFQREDGSYGALVLSGTRDPVFQKNFESIKAAVLSLIAKEFPDALQNATYTITIADVENPAIVVRSVDKDAARLDQKHQAELDTLLPLISLKPNSLKNLDTADVYQWSLYHLLTNEQVIQEKLFPIKLFNATSQDWTFVEEMMPVYSDVGVKNYKGDTNERTLSVIQNHPPQGEPKSYQLLANMAVVIRSKDAGVNRLTYDIIFNSIENYQTALRSNVFSKENVAPMVHVPIKHIVGTYHVDSCNAIKISIDRPIISASLDETDVFGCQQEAEFILMQVPVY